MRYDSVIQGTFLSRPNRFIAVVDILGREERVHVKNTGRCRELLIPGVCVFLEKSRNPARKTAYSLIAVQKGDRLINMDSQAPNAAAWEYLLSGMSWIKPDLVQREKTYKDSRFDLYYEQAGKKGFIEVKGVTLEEDGVVLFPDAPTLRGLKHIKELENAACQGYEAEIWFIIQMENVRYFTPNIRMQPEFGQALKDAKGNGVKIHALWCHVTEDSMEVAGEVPVIL